MDITDRLMRGDAGTAYEASVLIRRMRSEIAGLKMRIAEIEGRNADLMVSCESYRKALIAYARST